ncbi:MAG: NADPH:quinone oxidoreductase family protein [Hyphomicrobiales bacterium]|nr:NADPH:quinone oxidoreductase family protein [Hyphomicrobiales bacterium]
MRALISREVGGPETLRLEELPTPEARPGHIVVDVRACGVNYPDALIIRDMYQFKPGRPFAPGGEISGVVSAVGQGVTHLAVGDRILASCGWGGMSEQVAIDASRAVKIPDSMPFDEAAAFLMTYGTSHHALKDRARLEKGETLLVLGAAGGVGIAAVELGAAWGARVIAAVSTKEKADFCMKHGASETVVYPAGPFDKDGRKELSEIFKKACGANGADVIYDGVGGDYAEASLRSIAWEGRFLVVGFPAGIPKLPLNLTLLKGCDVLGVFWGDFVRRFPAQHQANLKDLMGLYTSGKIRPYVSERFPLERAAESIDWLSARKAMGKVVVTMG